MLNVRDTAVKMFSASVTAGACTSLCRALRQHLLTDNSSACQLLKQSCHAGFWNNRADPLARWSLSLRSGQCQAMHCSLNCRTLKIIHEIHPNLTMRTKHYLSTLSPLALDHAKYCTSFYQNNPCMTMSSPKPQHLCTYDVSPLPHFEPFVADATVLYRNRPNYGNSITPESALASICNALVVAA